MNRLSCAFTGHRPENLPDGGDRTRPGAAALFRELEETVEALWEGGVLDFYCGGARGFDTWAAQAVLALKKRDGRVRLHLILPHWGQEARWSLADRAEYTRIARAADETRILSDRYFHGCMQARNRALVDHARILVAYAVKSTGGSAYTVGYAEKQGVPVIRLGQRDEQISLLL